MSYINGKCVETKYNCKHCGENKMSPNYSGKFVNGWRCEVCLKVCYPIRDELEKLKYNNKNAFNVFKQNSITM